MNAAKVLTPRLSAEWDGLINWATENDVEDSLKLLLDCSVIHDRLDLLPTIIDRLGSNNCIETLSRWSKSDSYSYHLYRLIVSFQFAPYKTAISNILSEHKPAKSQFYSNLNYLYLVSSITERLPIGKADKVQWFERLRLWLVVKAIRAASSHNLQDAYLRDLFRYLRIAADQLSGKLNLINELMVDANGYHAFNRAVEQKAKQLLLNSGYKNNDINFLNTLIKICNNNFHPEHFESIQPIYEIVNHPPRVAEPKNLSGNESDSKTKSDEEKHLVEVPEDSDIDLAVEADVDPDQPQELKTLTGLPLLS